MRFGAGLLLPLRVPKGCLHLRTSAGATGYCCPSAVCAMKLGCWIAAGAGCKMFMALWASGPDGDNFHAVAKESQRLVAAKKNAIWDLCLRKNVCNRSINQ